MNQAELFFPRPVPRVQVDATPKEQPEDDTPFVFEDTAPEPRVAYITRLVDYPAVDDARVAEQRFRRELDRQLGADVLPALRLPPKTPFNPANLSARADGI